jgi:hypothetical protein
MKSLAVTGALLAMTGGVVLARFFRFKRHEDNFQRHLEQIDVAMRRHD